VAVVLARLARRRDRVAHLQVRIRRRLLVARLLAVRQRVAGARFGGDALPRSGVAVVPLEARRGGVDAFARPPGLFLVLALRAERAAAVVAAVAVGTGEGERERGGGGDCKFPSATRGAACVVARNL
jgi:hypothetical protein